MTNRILTRTGTLALGEDGILRAVVFPKAELTLEDAKENVAALHQMDLQKECPLLLDMREILYVDRDARKFYESATGVPAVAILINSPISKVIGNFFVGLNKTTVPIKLCTSEAEATEWLKGFLR